MGTESNIFLNGPHAPSAVEGRFDDLPVIGSLPSGLSGAWYTMSSNPLFPPQMPERYHWFEGDGMICALTLANGRASVATRWVESVSLLAERRAGRALYGPFVNGSVIPMPPPAEGPPTKSPANTTAMMFADRLFVFSEEGLPHVLDPETLQTLGQFDFGSIQGPVSAHGRVDPDNGDLLFYGAVGPQLIWYRADRNARLLESQAFATGQPYVVHDFAVTPGYAIFFTTPTIVDIEGVQRGGAGMVWEDGLPATIWLLERGTGKVTSIVMPERFAITHFLNAWQEGNEIVVHGNRTHQWAVARADIDKPLKPGFFYPAFPWEWRIDSRAGTVRERQISTVNCEFARHDPRRVGRRVRYGYYAATGNEGFGHNWLFDRIMKLDIDSGAAVFSRPEGLTAPSETIFVPRPGGVKEDDGWTMTLWWNPAVDRTATATGTRALPRSSPAGARRRYAALPCRSVWCRTHGEGWLRVFGRIVSGMHIPGCYPELIRLQWRHVTSMLPP